MNKKINIGRGGTITLNDKHFLASGGEASVYLNGGKIYKIYHDSKKILPQQKIKELSVISNPSVVIPKDLIYENGNPIGYTTNYVNDCEPLLKLFTKTFKDDNNIDKNLIAALVKQLQLITTDIHSAKCLIVDFNELNVLVNIKPTILTPFFIDVDSYVTPTFNKANAIMDSVRDRRVSSLVNGQLLYKPDELSDWFSWAILTFYLYTNIHPYRGNHPNYKPNQKGKQMDDGISIFHPNVKVPKVVNNFNVIPPRHKSWYESVFLRNERSIPPLPDSIVPIPVSNNIVIVQGTNNIDVIQKASYSENIQSVTRIMGIDYVVTSKRVYSDNKELKSDCNKFKKVLICPASDGTPIVATLSGLKIVFTELHRQREFGTAFGNDMFCRNGAIYTIANGKLIENRFKVMGTKIIHVSAEVDNVSTYSTTMYEGCVLQNLLGKWYLTLPYSLGACFSKNITQLEGYRIVGCKSERNIVICIGERNGKYDKFIIVFKKDYTEFDVRKIEDVTYDVINMTIREDGLCIHLANDELELFGNNQNITVLANPPFDATMKLFNTSEGIFFICGTSIHQIKKK